MEIVDDFKLEVCPLILVVPRPITSLHLQVNSLVNSKLPVSRAKMSQITKLAMKGMKVCASDQWRVYCLLLIAVLQAHSYDCGEVCQQGAVKTSP